MTQSYDPYGNQQGQSGPGQSPAYGEDAQTYSSPAYYETTGTQEEVFDQNAADRGPDLLDAPAASTYSTPGYQAEPAYVPPVYAPAPADDQSGGAAQKAKDTAATAKDEAANVGQTAADSAQHVAGVAKEQASGVAGEAVSQAKDLLTQSRGELTGQASSQQQRIAGGLHSLGDELHAMGQSSDQPGVASDLVRQAADRSHQIASWLDDREPGQVITELQDFARRKPGTFLIGAALLGVVGGRFTRGIVAAKKDDDTSAAVRPAATPAVAPYPVATEQSGYNSGQGYAANPALGAGSTYQGGSGYAGGQSYGSGQGYGSGLGQ